MKHLHVCHITLCLPSSSCKPSVLLSQTHFSVFHLFQFSLPVHGYDSRNFPNSLEWSNFPYWIILSNILRYYINFKHFFLPLYILIVTSPLLLLFSANLLKTLYYFSPILLFLFFLASVQLALTHHSAETLLLMIFILLHTKQFSGLRFPNHFQFSFNSHIYFYSLDWFSQLQILKIKLFTQVIKKKILLPLLICTIISFWVA